jgi:iron complex outermembrane receptor protein
MRQVALAVLLLLAAAHAHAQAEGEASPASTQEPAPEQPVEAPLDTIPVKPSEPEAVPVQPKQEEGRRLEEIVVTATKRAKSRREIPMSVDAFTGDELEERGAHGLEEILKYSPGVVINEDGEGENAQISIRGINTSILGGSRNRTFGVFYEDVSVLNPSYRGPQPQLDPFDMQTVEVLKGPQGTLFGGSALAGAIRYVPERAEPGRSYGKLGASVARVAHGKDLGTRYTGMYNLSLGETVALRAAGTMIETPGYVDDLRSGMPDINSGRTDTGRLMFSAKLWEDLQLEASYLVRTNRQDDGRRLSGPHRDYVVNNRRDPDTEKSRVDVVSVKLSYDFEPFKLVGLFGNVRKRGYVHTDISLIAGVLLEGQDQNTTIADTTGLNLAQLIDGAVAADVLNELDLYSNQPSYELRLVSNEPTGGWWPFRDWEYLVGLYYMRSDQLYDQNVTGGPGAFLPVPPAVAELLGLRTGPSGDVQPTGYIFIFDGVTREKAAFFDLTRKFGWGLELNLGGRYFEIDPQVTILTGVLSEDLPTVPEPSLDDEGLLAKESGFNPKAALTWQPGKHFSIFGGASKGFRFGGVNSRAVPVGAANPFPLTYKSDTLWNYEVGIRTDWFKRRLQVDLTGFYIDWKDLQIDQNFGEAAFVYVDNVGAARSQGAELATRAILPWGFGLIAGGAYIDARTTEDFTSTDGDAAAGSRLPSAPYVSAAAVLNWNWVSSSLALGANVGWTYQSESNSSLSSPEKIGSFSTFSGGLRLSAPSWVLAPELALNVINIPDKFIVLYESSGQLIKVAGVPRTITLGLTLSF